MCGVLDGHPLGLVQLQAVVHERSAVTVALGVKAQALFVKRQNGTLIRGEVTTCSIASRGERQWGHRVLRQDFRPVFVI